MKDTEFAAVKLPRCLKGGVESGVGWHKSCRGRLEETVAPSTRALGTTPDGPGFTTWQTAAPPAEDCELAAPKSTSPRQAAAFATSRSAPPASRTEFWQLCTTSTAENISLADVPGGFGYCVPDLGVWWLISKTSSASTMDSAWNTGEKRNENWSDTET